MIGSKGDAMVRPGWSEGEARVKQRSSKGSNSSMKGGEGCTNLIPKYTKNDKNDAYLLRLFTLFAFSTVFSSLPLAFFTSPRLSLLSLRSCSKRMLGAERVERSENRWKNGES